MDTYSSRKPLKNIIKEIVQVCYKWEINPGTLFQYNKKNVAADYFAQTEDQKYGILIYNICEHHMCAFNGMLAIYEKSNLEEPIINLKKTRVWFQREYTFEYESLSKCMSFISVLPISSSPQSPFIFINLERRQYAILPWDFTSIYYGWKEISENHLQLYEKNPNDELRRFEKVYENFSKEIRETYEETRKKHKTGEILNLESLDWKDVE